MTQSQAHAADLVLHVLDATMTAPIAAVTAPASLAPRVFIAEADSASAEMLRELLTSEGYKVSLSVHLGDALAMLSTSRWEIALVSSFSASGQQPGTWPSLRRLIAAAGATPVVLLTGHALPDDDVRDLGLAGLLRKPYDVELLLDTVSKVSNRG